MSKLYLLPVAIICLLATARAQTELEIRSQLDTIDRQIGTLRQANMRSPTAQRLRAEMDAAVDDYRKALNQIPGIKEINKEIQDLRSQMANRQRRKSELIKEHSTLKEIKKRCDERSVALHEYITGGEQIKNLQAENQRLRKALSSVRKSDETITK